jgi:Zn-dependent peptidase ImmA (M78 family)
MSADHHAPKRSDKQVRQEAIATKREYKTEDRRPVNIIRHLQSGWIPTRRGRKKLVYKIVEDNQMGDDDGKTEFADDEVIISVKRSVHQKALWGDGRARMTLAHELAHGVMHYGVALSRRFDAIGTTELSRISAAESAEHQAKVFASAFLIDDAVAARLSSPEEISTEFLVSLEAAEICFERLAAEAEHAESAERVRQSNEIFHARMRDAAGRRPFWEQEPKYTGDFCGICGNATLIPMGTKLLCKTCGNVSDPQ